MLDYLVGNLKEKFTSTLLKEIDLNKILEPGEYFGLWGNNCINTPEPARGEFYLKILSVGSTYRVQIYIDALSKVKMFIRGWNYSTNNFGPWKKFTLTDV